MAEVEASAAGCCGLCVYSVFASWCTLHPFGADVRCCGGPRGCCGSCFDSSFDKDDFDERLKKEQEKNTQAEPVHTQPEPTQGMSQVVGDPNPANVEA